MSADSFVMTDVRLLAALLEWQAEIGVDLALDEAPHDRFAESAAAALAPAPASRPAPAAATTLPAPRARPAPVDAETALRAARESAAEARDLDDLYDRLRRFEHIALNDGRRFIPGAGAPGARLMVFDSAPGAEEEAEGAAFAGPRGKLLDNILKSIGLGREAAYLAYLSPWRPSADRPLGDGEIELLAPFARRHVALVRPRMALIFGDAPARALLGAGEPLAKLRGTWRSLELDGIRIAAMPLYGLKTLLDSPGRKRAVWSGLRAARARLEETL